MPSRTEIKQPVSDQTLEMIRENFNFKPTECNLRIRDLDEELNAGDLIVDYEYQREYLYESKDKDASKFVESVFMGLVIPEIQLFEDLLSQRKEIIDGQQRVFSLIRFLRNEYPLTGLDVLTDLQGLYYKDLPSNLQKAFKNYTVKGRVVNRDHHCKYEMFARLNTGATKLTKQEVRNCVFNGQMIDLAKRIAREPQTQAMFYGLNNLREDITELVIRFLALIQNNGCLSGTYASFINKFLSSEFSRTLGEKEADRIYSRFMSTVKLINSSFDLKSLFSELTAGAKTYPKGHIEALFIPIYLINEPHNIRLNSDLLFAKIEDCMKNNPDYLDTAFKNAHVSSSVSVNKRISIIKDLIQSEISQSDSKTDARRLFTAEEKEILWEEQLLMHGKVCCALCGNTIYQLDQCEVDHIIPWSKGGQTVLSNGQLTHISCNRTKSDQMN